LPAGAYCPRTGFRQFSPRWPFPVLFVTPAPARAGGRAGTFFAMWLGVNDALRTPLLIAAGILLCLIIARGFYVDLTHPAPIDRGTYAAAGVTIR